MELFELSGNAINYLFLNQYLSKICFFFVFYRSPAILTLDYFKSLELIHYEPNPDQKRTVETENALEIVHNTNIYELFNFENSSRTSLTIEGGGVLIDSNPKLCPQMILKSLAKITYDKSNTYVGNVSNGQHAICVYREFKTSIKHESSSVVSIFWPRFDVNEGDKLQGYTVFYIKTDQNVTLNTGFDACEP